MFPQEYYARTVAFVNFNRRIIKYHIKYYISLYYRTVGTSVILHKVGFELLASSIVCN